MLNSNLQQFSSSELSEQCCCPSHTQTLRIQAPVVVHLKSSGAGHVRLSAERTIIMVLSMQLNIIICYENKQLSCTHTAYMYLVCSQNEKFGRSDKSECIIVQCNAICDWLQETDPNCTLDILRITNLKYLTTVNFFCQAAGTVSLQYSDNSYLWYKSPTTKWHMCFTHVCKSKKHVWHQSTCVYAYKINTPCTCSYSYEVTATK